MATPPPPGPRPGVLDRHTLVDVDGRRLHVYGDLRGTIDDRPSETPPAVPHKRFDVLTGQWVAVAPTRNTRPHTAETAGADACPLCPGGEEVPFDFDVAVFDNRYPTFVATAAGEVDDLSEPAVGRCEVLVYTPSHAGSLGALSPVDLARVVAVMRDRTTELWKGTAHRWVMAFENRGEAVGATLSHPHGQVYALDHLPPFIAARVGALESCRHDSAGCAGCAVVAGSGDREIVANPSFSVAVPFAARWPFEVHVRSRRHGLGRLADLSDAEQKDLAAALRTVVLRYDALYDRELPYMMVVLESPEGEPDWHLAVEFYPLSRTAVLDKVRASVETATGLFINDTVPEASAERLRRLDVPEVEEVAAIRVEPAGDRRRPGAG